MVPNLQHVCNNTNLTRVSFDDDDGNRGRLNPFCEPTGAGKGGAEWTADAKLNACIHFCKSCVSLI